MFGFVGAAAVIAAGIANIKQIAASKPPPAPNGGSSGGSVSVPAASAPATPAFNVVGASASNQLAEAIGEQAQQPVQAFVVSNDVTTAQELDRNIIQGATIG